MLYYNFKNYEEFKSLFGFNEHGNGVKSRRNKILLGLYKDRTILHDHITGGARWLYCKSLDDVKSVAFSLLEDKTYSTKSYLVSVGDLFTAYSDKYTTDICKGVCQDGDINAVRYVNRENDDHVYKMKAGKFLRAIIDESGLYMPECIKTWLCEVFTSEWRTYAAAHGAEYTLHVDDDFEGIYSSDRCLGHFGSCMTDRNRHSFYEDAVKAKAAYLENRNGEILARCVVFTDVEDADGNKYRLAERQYSSNGNEDYKRMLVDRLIREGHIDGYKRIGAGCGDADAFLGNNGEDWSDKRFQIDCYLEPGDTLSYQDSFKWYDIDEHVAYNYSCGCDYIELDTTEDTIPDTRGAWSDYHQEYIPEDDATYCEHRGDYFYNDEVTYCENTGTYEYEDDCVQLYNGDYAYYGRNCDGYDGVCRCEVCDEYFLEDDGYYSEKTGDYYCSSDCLCQAEEDWYRDNDYTYSEWDNEWYENEDDVIEVLEWGGCYNRYWKTTISVESFNRLARQGRATEFNDEYYIDVVMFDGEPAHAAA